MNGVRPATATSVVYCGDTLYLDAIRGAVVDITIRHLDAGALLAEGRQSFQGISVIVLTLHDGNAVRAGGGAVRSRAGLADEVPRGLELLGQLSDFRKKPPVVLLAPSGTSLEMCCAAVQMGVMSFVDTDAEGWAERLAGALRQIRAWAPAQVSATAQRTPQELLDAVGIMAVSPAMQELIVQAQRAAQVSDATVLIQGESGTGKQLLAEAIHRLDPKRGRFAFVPVNCAAITGSLAESELFGHVRGAFTGATETRAGYFRTAHRGTILLDEISELPMPLQPKLLRVIQEGRVLPVGSDREEGIDVRVIAASNAGLQERVAAGVFRLDLYQRLNVIHLMVPPLRQRTEDIPLLVRHFVRKYQHYCEHPIVEVDPRVYELLKRRLGNGNVRELENVIRQTLVFKTQGERMELADMPRYLFQGPEPATPTELIPTVVADHLVTMIQTQRLTLRQAMAMFERAVIVRAAQQSPQLTRVQLAQTLGLPRRTLYYKLDEAETKPDKGG